VLTKAKSYDKCQDYQEISLIISFLKNGTFKKTSAKSVKEQKILLQQTYNNTH
jgi:hypothetical protein